MDALRFQIDKDRVQNMTLMIFETGRNEVLEKWLFDFRQMPRLKHHAWEIEFGTEAERFDLHTKISVGDVEQSFRSFFSALDTVSSRLAPLPDGEGAPEYSFTIAMETRRWHEKPLDHLNELERRWVYNEPGVFGDDPYYDVHEDGLPEELQQRDKKVAKPTFKAIRRVDAGGLRLQAFVVEAQRKFTLPTTFKTMAERAAELSYGAGTEQMPPEDEVFDPEEGYDLGEREIHRKPGGGAFTDYLRDRR